MVGNHHECAYVLKISLYFLFLQFLHMFKKKRDQEKMMINHLSNFISKTQI